MTRRQARLMTEGQTVVCIAQTDEWTKEAMIEIGEELTIARVHFSERPLDIEHNTDISLHFEDMYPDYGFSYLDFEPVDSAH